MGWFSRKSESYSVDDLLSMSDREIRKAVESGEVPSMSPKELRKQAADIKRKVSGETGVSAIAAGLKGGGTGNRKYESIPLKERVHPARYKQLLEKEAKKQGLL